MTISRSQMARELYQDGTVPSKIKRLALALNITEEEAANIYNTLETPEVLEENTFSADDNEVMERLMFKQQAPEYQYNEENLYEGPRDMRAGGGFMNIEPRQNYGLGSIVKSVKKAVKGATKSVGDIVSSDLGKAALLYAGTAGLANLGAGGGFGSLFKLGTYAPSMVGSNLLTAATRGASALGMLKPGGGIGLPTISKSLGTAGKILGGSALLSSLFGSVDQAQEAFNRDPAFVKSSLAKYYRNINKDASEEEVQEFVNQNILEFGDVGRSDVVSGYETTYGGRLSAAIGGIMDIPTGEIKMNKGGVKELDYREEGGFVPVGIKEKADDVPAMLSKNEFVMTADAVRGMGNGNVEKGAQKMYNMMKSLENRIE